uniref:Reverse transcriptase domain-containing protein n=1 Tax=Haemonchus contortus TaxID=6289 RepID=A0A7I4Z0Y8_HAECO
MHHFIMRETTQQTTVGIRWFDHKRHTDQNFADDIALLAEDKDGSQKITDTLSEEASMIGLRISASKSKAMSIGQACTQVNINVEDTMLKNVEKFTYLRSTTHDGDIKTDDCGRTAKATDLFRRLQPIWSISSISRNIKIRLYSSIVIPTAICASETWKYMASPVKKIDAFHQRCLRRIIKIRYKEHVTNEKALRCSGMNSLRLMVARRRLDWPVSYCVCRSNVSQKWLYWTFK